MHRDGGMQLCCAIVHVGMEDKDGTNNVQWFLPSLISFGFFAQRSGVPEVHDIFIDCFWALDPVGSILTLAKSSVSSQEKSRDNKYIYKICFRAVLVSEGIHDRLDRKQAFRHIRCDMSHG